MSEKMPSKLVISTRVLQRMLFASPEFKLAWRIAGQTDLFVAEPSWTAIEHWIARCEEAEPKIENSFKRDMAPVKEALSRIVSIIPEPYIRPCYDEVSGVTRREQLFVSCALARLVDAPVWGDAAMALNHPAVTLWVTPPPTNE